MDSLEEMVRDFTKTRPRAKSEVRKRITQYAVKIRRNKQ